MNTIKKILVPIDFSPCSRRAFELAQALAGPLGAQIDVLHVAELANLDGQSTRVATSSGTTPLGEYAVQLARSEMDRFLASLPQAENRFGVLLDSGQPRQVILDHARRDHYDLVVMGTNGRTGRARMLAGSVAESVVRSASCPVLTVREPD